MSGFSNDNERPIIDRRPRRDEKPIIDRKSSSNQTATFDNLFTDDFRDDFFAEFNQTGSGTPISKPATTGHYSTNAGNNSTGGSNSNLSKYLLIAVAVIAVILSIVFFTRDTSVNDFNKLLDAGDYEAAVAMYNEEIAGDKEKEDEVYSNCELAILSIQESFGNGNISFDTAQSNLNAIAGIENSLLADQVSEVLDDMTHISDGQAHTNEGRYADAVDCYLLIDSEKPLYKASCTYIATCVDQLVGTAEDNANEDHLQAMLNVAELLMTHQDFASKVQEMEGAAVRLTQKLAEEYAQGDNHQQAMTVVQYSRNVFAENHELDAMFNDYLQQYEKHVSAQVDELVSSNDYASARTLLEQMLAEYPDNQAFLNLQKSVAEKQAVYEKQIGDQVNGYVAAGDYTAAFDLIAQVRKADPENSVYEDLEQTTLKAYETYISNQVQTLVGKDDYSAALSLVEQTLKAYPANQCFRELKTEIQAIMPKNFMDVCAPYDYSNSQEITSAVEMAGEKYANGFVQNSYDEGRIISNLGGKYSKMTFTVGHVDGTRMCDYEVEIYLDGAYYDSFAVKATGMPFDVTVPLSGKEQLIIKWDAGHRQYQDGCRIAFTNIIVYPDADPVISEDSKIDTASWDNFMDVCKPYDYVNAHAISSAVEMAGERYTNGFVQDSYSGGQIISNLGNKYSEMTFTVGHVDGTRMCDYEVEIYLDGAYYDSFVVKATGMPFDVTIPLSGKEQLMIKWDAGHNRYQDGCRIAFANIMIH